MPRGDPARIRCWMPNVPNAILRWQQRGGSPLPAGARDDGRGTLHFQSVEQAHQSLSFGEHRLHSEKLKIADAYECTYNPSAGSPTTSEPANLRVQERRFFVSFFTLIFCL